MKKMGREKLNCNCKPKRLCICPNPITGERNFTKIEQMKKREELEKAQQAAEDFKLHQGTDRYDFSQFSQAFGGSVNPFKVLKR